MKNCLYLLILLFNTLVTKAQIKSSDLNGDWVLYKKEMKDGSKYFYGGTPKNSSGVITFSNNSYIFKDFITDRNHIFKFPFTIKNDLLISLSLNRL